MKHQFAVYVEALSQELGSLKQGTSFEIQDKGVLHRMITVLRLKQWDELVLFDAVGHAVVTIQEINKKKVICAVQKYLFNRVHKPTITLLLPLLKREAFEEALYSTVELGASVVQLVITDKVQREWGGKKENERIQRVMIAAAEQSKNFSLPSLHDPVALMQIIEEVKDSTNKIFFDPMGQPLLSLLNKVHEMKMPSIICMIGPEGDLSENEKELLKRNNFSFYALTPTILRASQALVVGLGALRSVIIKEND